MKSWQTLLFRNYEWISASLDAYGTALYSLERIDETYAFFAINPLKRGTTRADSNISAYRNFLIEMDEGTIEEQWNYVVNTLKMPFSLATYSGGKSYHFIISLSENVTEEVWRELMALLLKAVPRADRSTCNPSRFSRVPNHNRLGGKPQTLREMRTSIAECELREFIDRHVSKKEQQILMAHREVESLSNAELPEGLRLPLSPRTRRFLEFGALSGASHNEAVLAAHNLRSCNYSEEEVYLRLSKAPWPTVENGEIENIVNHAFNVNKKICP